MSAVSSDVFPFRVDYQGNRSLSSFKDALTYSLNANGYSAEVESEIKRDSWSESQGRNDFGKVIIDARIKNLDEPLHISIIAETHVELSNDSGRLVRTEHPDYTPYVPKPNVPKPNVPKPNQNSNDFDFDNILYGESFVKVTITRIDGNSDEFNKLCYYVKEEFTHDLERVHRGGKRHARRRKTRARRGKKRATRRRRV